MSKNDEDVLIYKVYPRQVGRIAALAEIAKAVARIVKDDSVTPLEARRTLYKATLLYSRSPEGRNPDKTKIPHPRTWFHQGRYLDDPKEWQHGGFNNAALPTGKTDRNMAILAEIIGEEKHRGGASEDGLFPTVESGQDGRGAVLEGPRRIRP